MQGTLSEIDTRSILQLIELGQRTGELFVETYSTSFGANGSDRHSFKPSSAALQSWFVFFLNGQIIYAGAANDDLSRLRNHLQRFRKEAALDKLNIDAIATLTSAEYGHLWALIENHTLTPTQGRNIIQSMVKETLFDLLSLHQGAFIFEMGFALSPQLTTFEISPLVASTTKQVQGWKQLHPLIQSPHQCPLIANEHKLRESLTETTFKALSRWVDGKTSLRQIARYTNRDLLTVARAIYPYLQSGLMQFSFTPPEDGILPRTKHSLMSALDRVPRIVCVDDGAMVRETVEAILNAHGYEATSISNPLRALSLLFQLKPDLILCDIAMPELDGYEICAMLRKSTAFRQTPIVMLTGKDGFIDRAKARMFGATDYLTKPFGEHELITLVEKYVGMGNPDRPKPEALLADALDDD